MTWIYGIKSSNFNVNLKEFESLVNKYMVDEQIPIIVGCTELSLLIEKVKTETIF